MSLMEYISTQQRPTGGAGKYHGLVAAGYDGKRKDDPKRVLTKRIVEDMLSDLPAGSWVLDCPCGTGRFLPFAEGKGLIYLGVDVSVDMLKQAAAKVTNPQKVRLEQASIFALPREDESVDASLMIDLTRWLMGDHGPDGIKQALGELQRVTRQRIILTARVRNHKFAVTYELIASALDGWKIHRDEAGVDLDYRIIELRPC